jgi:hypothetical protein
MNSYNKRKSDHQLQTIQPKVAGLFNKYRSKKLVFFTEEQWENGEKNNQEQFKKSKDTIVIVLDKNSNPVWQSHK